MTHTYADALDKLGKETELDFLEILDLSTEELVDLLRDEIETKIDKVLAYYDEQTAIELDGEEESD